MPGKDTNNKQILLLGAYGRGNAGDDMFLTSAKDLFQGYDIYINSADDKALPPEARKYVSTISTTSPKDIIKKIRVFLSIRSAVYWGGDLWVQLYGAPFPRQLLYKMIVLNCLLKLMGKKIYYVGCGIGPLGGYTLSLARLSARMASLIVVREQRSAAVLNLPQVKLLPDLAVNIPYYTPKLHSYPTKGKPFIIGISLLYYLPDPEKNFPRYIRVIAKLLKTLPKNKFKVVLFPMHVSSEQPNDDLWASEQLMKRLTNLEVELFTSNELKAIIEKMGSCNLMIGTRLHANILSSFNATPALGIAYRPKVRAFFEENNIGQFCLELHELQKIESLFWRMCTDYDKVAESYFRVSKDNLKQRSQYKQLIRQMTDKS